MLATTSSGLSAQIAALVKDCLACEAASSSCADVCAASGLTDTFRSCELACSDCADVCRTTAQVTQRYSGGDTRALIALLGACARACAECAAECENHKFVAAEHCALASLECKQACERLAGALRWR